MLVLSRKVNERLILEVAGQRVEIVVTDIDRGRVRIGIEAAREVVIYREELGTKEGQK